MKLNVGDEVWILNETSLKLKVKVEDASKSDIIQAKVEALSDDNLNNTANFTYEVGKVYDFPRKDIVEPA